MALTVGELNAILSIDDRAVEPALRRAENALRASGQRMGGDADRAGQQAGQQLGGGFVRGADGQWRNMQGQLVDAVRAASLEAESAARRGGQRAGDALGDGLTDGAAAGADDAVDAAEGGLSRLQTVALAAGAGAGAILIDAFGQAMEQSKITGKLAAGMGKTPAEAERYGHIAGQLYADAVTEDFQGAADVIGAAMAAGLVPPDATNAQIKSISANLSDLAGTFELDLGQAANAVGQIMKTGLAPDAQGAMDVITRGLQVMGPRADDIADTFNEYSTIFRQLGISAGDATGIMAQGMAAGARDTDVVADALKELTLITQGGGKAVDAAFKSIGLSGKEMQTAFSKGGPEAEKGLDKLFDALRKVKDPAKRAQLAVTLFGTKAEDMQKALFAIDPSKAVSALGAVGGATDKLGVSIRDNAATQIDQFKRRSMQKLVDFLGTKAIPALMKAFNFVQEHSGAFKVAGAVIAGVLVPALVLMGVTATVAAGRVVLGWTTSGAASVRSAAIQVGASLRTAGAWVMMQLRAVGAFAATAGAAVLSAARTAAAWLLAGARMTATFLVAVLRVAAVAIGQFALMAVRAIAWAAVMAAQWLIAMGPVGWVIAVVIGLVALIIANWSTIQKWTGKIWDWVWTKVMSAVGRIISAVKFLGRLPGLVSGYFGKAKDVAVRKALDLVAWMAGWPDRISKAVGALGSLLVEKGHNIVEGLWAGIQSMGGWIAGKITSWAKSVIPGPIAKALGINSPSKVTKSQGRWIARGLIDGLTGSTKQVRAASRKLADIVADSLAPGKKRSKALGRISADSKRLLKLAGQEDRLASRMKAASKRLADMLSARTKLAADVKRGILDAANITQRDTDKPVTAEEILGDLRTSLGQAKRFASDLAALRKKGVRSDLIAQIAQAGVEQGSATAAALARADKGTISQINATQGALVTAAGKAGAVAGDAMYGAGIRAAQGLVKGLQSEQKQIEKQMLAIARGMSKAIRAALGIKSPSRVMARVGAFTAEGLRQGIESGRTAVNRSMASLVDTPAPGSYGWPGGSGRGAGVQRTVVEIRSSGRKQDDMQLEMLRGSIRKKGGKDASLVLTGRRGG